VLRVYVYTDKTTLSVMKRPRPAATTLYNAPKRSTRIFDLGLVTSAVTS